MYRIFLVEDDLALAQAEALLEQDYQDMIRRLGDEIEQVTATFAADKQDMSDYYTAWVHQIKTPIAVMRMQLADGANEQTKALSAELFRIEQYVEMALTYIRLDAEGNDLVLETYALDDLIRQTIRKYAPQFIYKKIGMNFEETGKQVVTDRKSSGLGLYLCKKAADKLSLRLTAESTPGVGSTFYIDFGEML